MNRQVIEIGSDRSRKNSTCSSRHIEALRPGGGVKEERRRRSVLDGAGGARIAEGSRPSRTVRRARSKTPRFPRTRQAKHHRREPIIEIGPFPDAGSSITC